VQEEEFISIKKSDPAGTLRLLLSKKQQQAATSSEHTTSDSGPSNVEINSLVHQDSLLLKGMYSNNLRRTLLAPIAILPF
jgi:hypothetical protein